MSTSVEEFVTKYLEFSRSQVRTVGKCLFVNLKGEPEHSYAITFTREEAEKQECEHVAVGTPFFNLITEDIRRRGSAFARLPAVDPNDALKRIPCVNCKLELVTAEEIPHHALKLCYLVTVLTTKRQQKNVEVAIDDSGQEASWLYDIRDFKDDEKPDKFEKEFIQFLLDRAAQIIRDKVNKELNVLRGESESLLSESINRIQNYYAELRDETINQAEYVRSQIQDESISSKRPIFSSISFEEAEKLISDYDKLEALDIEKERARYQIKAEAKLVTALLLSYSSLRCRLMLRNFNEGISKEILLNLLPNDEVEDPILCDVCKQPIREIHLCLNGHVVGDECVATQNSRGDLCTICKSLVER